MTFKTHSLENWKHHCRKLGAVREDSVTVPGTHDTILRYINDRDEVVGAWNASTNGPGAVHEAPFPRLSDLVDVRKPVEIPESYREFGPRLRDADKQELRHIRDHADGRVEAAHVWPSGYQVLIFPSRRAYDVQVEALRERAAADL